MDNNETRKSDASRRAITAAGVAALVVPRHVLGGPGQAAPSDTLRIAGVGVGGMGRRYLEGCSLSPVTRNRAWLTSALSG